MKIHSSDESKEWKLCMMEASNFSKDTGDFKTLSLTDLKVIALGIKLAKERGEGDKVRK